MASPVQELRRQRRAHRLGELEWFEVAYRAYLVAFVGATIAVMLAGLVEDVAVLPEQLDEVRRLGPRVVGLLPVLALAVGLRSGSDGGPIAVEAADVHHLLLAPVPRRRVLARPVGQRLRSSAFTGALVGAVGGLLAADRLPGSRSAWIASGAASGAATAAAFVAVAVVTHASGVGRPAATGAAAVLVGAQGLAAADVLPAGPGDTIGSLALWGWRQHEIDLLGVGVVAGACGLAIALADRLRLAPLVRRAGLVAQLRFAATMQDLRTVMLLRRQLRGEHARARPWFRVPPGQHGPTMAVWARGCRGLARYPVSRLARMAGLALAAGAAAALAATGTTPAIIVTGAALHLLGLDALEPLSQEIDHPDRTDGVPHDRGWLLVRLLAPSALASIPMALLGGSVVAVVVPAHAALAIGLAVPVMWGGLAGAAVSVVRDAPDPVAAPTNAAMPPEFAGFATTARLLLPLVVSIVGVLPILLVVDQPSAGAAMRAALAAVLLTAAVAWWVRRRDEWRRRWRAFISAGRTATPSAEVSA